MEISEIIKDLQWIFANEAILLIQPKTIRRYDGNGEIAFITALTAVG